MLEKLDQYFSLRKEIFHYFGYVEDWKIISLEDHRDYFWCYLEEEDQLYISEKELSIQDIIKGEDFYLYSIYTQRFLPKWVYETNDFTMISVDTHQDGNKFLAIFDNKKCFVPSKQMKAAIMRWII